MAQKITVALEDDLDGGSADETVRFGFGGAEYEIDLSKKNATAFRRPAAAPVRGAVQWPPPAVAARNAVPAGRWSASASCQAADGPWSVIVMV
jgi:Lsr2